MAKQIIHKLVDDLDGGDADETVTFALDGVQYEIDLSASNADQLRDVFAPYTSSGAKVGRGGITASTRAFRGVAGPSGSRRARGEPGVDRVQNKAIRDWAKRTGKAISDRGRIPQEIVAEYHASAGRQPGA
ncbi:Lsr2 family protein [Micromonospora sp. WMMD980]|uniref:histone-like nucleoid-structuring protein Lsr2 n=1 Tax=Micromonospora sp. WMMD980 TaxID=3016088 RepID=UPI002415D7A8|nr:Lsr2 family protein [Micromonospora sp. WMMD980]MDG4803614.1 Lsr2 family protein [Micromonospora sp. WMMD980]